MLCSSGYLVKYRLFVEIAQLCLKRFRVFFFFFFFCQLLLHFLGELLQCEIKAQLSGTIAGSVLVSK